MYKSGLARELVTRVIAVTAVFSAVSVIVLRRELAGQSRIDIAIPMLFVLFGGVVMVQVLYSLRRHRAPSQA